MSYGDFRRVARPRLQTARNTRLRSALTLVAVGGAAVAIIWLTSNVLASPLLR